jgi:hypothetical protein
MKTLEINEKLEVIIGTKNDLLSAITQKSTPIMKSIYDRLPCTSYWKNKKFYIIIQSDYEYCRDFFTNEDKDNNDSNSLDKLFAREYIENCGYSKESFSMVWNKICLNI